MAIAEELVGNRLDVRARDAAPSKIVLANLVASQEGSKEYEYIATRIYDAETGAVVDTVLESKGRVEHMSEETLGYGMWRELPVLDIRTKQLVGKNKDKYCTLVAARVFLLPSTDKNTAVYELRAEWCDEAGSKYTGNVSVRILGYTFMDINGDKRYYTLAQLRKSDITQHVHSTRSEDVYKRAYMVTTRTIRTRFPVLEISAVDTTLDDEEVEQAKLLKTLVGGWYTMDADGALRVDREEIKKQQLEELEVPEGIIRIPKYAFQCLDAVKRIKLPESVQKLDEWAIYSLANLEEANIPSKVKVLSQIFKNCLRLKSLDLSGIEQLISFGGLSVKHLILPDVLQKNESSSRATIGVLEFRNTTNAEHRVLKAMSRRRVDWNHHWVAERVESNGPVVLGNYKVHIDCTDASALEPSIVGITSDSSFRKIDAKGRSQPWILGPATEFVYTAEYGYRFTPDACAANRLRVAVVDMRMNTVLPKSVEILQGKLSDTMLNADYSNVVYASHGLCCRHKFTEGAGIAPKLPSLRWILPEGKILEETQIKRLEKKLTLELPKICRDIQETLKLDLTKTKNLVTCRENLLTDPEFGSQSLFSRYGMIYVGDYNEVLRGK